MSIFDGVTAPVVRVEFDAAFPLGPKAPASCDWVTLDVQTSAIRNISIRRGKSQENQTVQPGQCTITFDNRTGDFDPGNEASPYWYSAGFPSPFSYLSPRLGMRVVATWSSTDYVLYQGYLEQVSMDWGINPTATITFVDLMSTLAQQYLEPVTAVGNGDQVWSRCNRILNNTYDPNANVLVPASLRYLDTSVTATMYGTTFGSDTLSLLQEAADCGPARLYVDRNGAITLLAMDGGFDFGLNLTDNPADTTGIGYDFIEVTPGAKYLINSVTVNKVDASGNPMGTVTGGDAGSQLIYGYAAKELTLPSNTAAPLADAYAYQFSNPIDRVTRVTFPGVNLGSNTSKVLETDLADYITVTRTTYDARTVTFSCTVEGIEHDITPENWRVSFLPGTMGVSTAGAWAQVLTSASSGVGRDATVGPNGEVYLAGGHNNKGYLARLSAAGEIQWQRQLTASSSASFYRAAAVEGAVYAVGQGDDPMNDALIVKYNDAGTLQWQRVMAGDIDAGFYGVNVDSAGNVIAVGFNAGAGYSQALVAKYNASGTLQWQRTLGTASVPTYAYGVTVDSADNIIVCGSTVISSTTAGLLAKYDSTGTLQWQRTLNGANAEIFETVVVDADDNIYVAGEIKPGASSALLVTKHNSSGVLQWQRALDADATNLEPGALGLTISAEGYLYASGYLYNDSTGSDDLLLACYALDGTLQWQRTISVDDTADSVFGWGIAMSGNAHVVIAGSVHFTSVNNNFMARLRADGAGMEAFEISGNAMTYAESTVEEATPTLTDAAGALTGATSTLTDAAGTLTSAAATLTQNIAYL